MIPNDKTMNINRKRQHLENCFAYGCPYLKNFINDNMTLGKNKAEFSLV